MFSFNNLSELDEKCTGLGFLRKVDPKLIIPNKELFNRQGAVKASGWNSLDDSSIAMMYFNAISETYGISLDEPVKNLDPDAVDIFLYGTQGQKLSLQGIPVSIRLSMTLNSRALSIILNEDIRNPPAIIQKQISKAV